MTQQQSVGIVAGIAMVVVCGFLFFQGGCSKPQARSYSGPEVEVIKDLTRIEERNRIAIEQQYGK
jgi:hypothetical protein